MGVRDVARDPCRLSARLVELSVASTPIGYMYIYIYVYLQYVPCLYGTRHKVLVMTGTVFV